MKRLKVVQIGIGHDHAIWAWGSQRNKQIFLMLSVGVRLMMKGNAPPLNIILLKSVSHLKKF